MFARNDISFIWVKCESLRRGACRTRGLGALWCGLLLGFFSTSVCVCVKKSSESFCRQRRRKKKMLSGYTERGSGEETVARNCAEAILFCLSAESAGQHKKTSKNAAERLTRRRSRRRQIKPRVQTQNAAQRRKTPKPPDSFVSTRWPEKFPHGSCFAHVVLLCNVGLPKSSGSSSSSIKYHLQPCVYSLGFGFLLELKCLL